MLCDPRDVAFERQPGWVPGIPVMSDRDKPVSFLVHGFMRRPTPPSTEAEDETEEAAASPAPSTPSDTPDADPASTKIGIIIPPCRAPLPSKAKQRELAMMKDCGYVRDADTGILALDIGEAKPMPVTWDFHPGRQDGYARILPRPGVYKHARGRRVPTKASGERATGRTYTCIAKECRKVFRTSGNLKRHVLALHGDNREHECGHPGCTAKFARADNLKKHMRTHGFFQEVFACAPTDGFRGRHVPNPHRADPDSIDIRPFGAMPIPPRPLASWRHLHALKATSEPDRVVGGAIEAYFRKHPEEREAALAGAPEWEWRGLPEPGAEFEPVGAEGRAWKGEFLVRLVEDPSAP